MIVLFKDGILGMIRGTVPVNVTGPVGLAQLTGEIVKTGIANLLSFAAVISLNLGIINIFPIPAMDGGRIVFVLLEWVRRGKRVSPKTEGMVHYYRIHAVDAGVHYDFLPRYFTHHQRSESGIGNFLDSLLKRAL